ncbi:hypothetical protein OH77DRAFT_1586984 [Trametes cingulata]|nr:hypothetical protein OH77DRAFT_1586984 [Trametes cingulata]
MRDRHSTPRFASLAFLLSTVAAQLNVTFPGGQDQWWVLGASNVVTWTCHTSPYAEFAIMLESWVAFYGPVMLVEKQKNSDCMATFNITSEMLAPSLRNAGQLPPDGYAISLAELDPATSTPFFIYADSQEFALKPAGAALPASAPTQGPATDPTKSTSSVSGQSNSLPADAVQTSNKAVSTSSVSGQPPTSTTGVAGSTDSPSGGPAGRASHSGPSTALIVALSVALPLVAVAAALTFWLYRHRQRNVRAQRSTPLLLIDDDSYHGEGSSGIHIVAEKEQQSAETDTVIHISAGDVSNLTSAAQFASVTSMSQVAARTGETGTESTDVDREDGPSFEDAPSREDAPSLRSSAAATYAETTDAPSETGTREPTQRRRVRARKEDAPPPMPAAPVTPASRVQPGSGGGRPGHSLTDEGGMINPTTARPPDITGPMPLPGEVDRPRRRFEYVTVLMEVGDDGAGDGGSDGDENGTHDEPPPYEPRPSPL